MAQRTDIHEADGAVPIITASGEGDVLVIQNAGNSPVEVDDAPVSLADPTKRGMVILPGQTQVWTGTLCRHAWYVTCGAGVTVPITWKRYTAG